LWLPVLTKLSGSTQLKSNFVQPPAKRECCLLEFRKQLLVCALEPAAASALNAARLNRCRPDHPPVLPERFHPRWNQHWISLPDVRVVIEQPSENKNPSPGCGRGVGSDDVG